MGCCDGNNTNRGADNHHAVSGGGCCGGSAAKAQEQGQQQGCCGAKADGASGCCAGQGHGHHARSHEPVVWSLFGAGGMLAAFVTPALLLCTALLAPVGLLGDALAFERVSALVDHWLGALVLWAVIALPLWHALHRLHHGLHDVKVGARRLSFALCYGSALLLTLYSGYLLFLG